MILNVYGMVINRTDMMVLTGIASGAAPPLSDEFSTLYGTGAPSTVFSSLKRLVSRGLLLKKKQITASTILFQKMDPLQTGSLTPDPDTKALTP